MSGAYQMVRRTARLWIRVPVTATAVLVLTSLGVAGVAAFFQPLYSLVLSPLPLPNPDQLVRLGGQVSLFNVYTNSLLEPERFQSVLVGVAAYAPAAGPSTEWRRSSGSRAFMVRALAVTPGFFDTLGVAPRVGHGIASDAGSLNEVVLSHRLWRAQFDGRPDIVGTSVDVGGRSRTVVGVMPAQFDFPAEVDAWMPIGSASYLPTGLEVIGRLRSGLDVSKASADLQGLGLKPAFGPAGQFGANGPHVQSLQVYLRGDTRATLWILWAVSGAFLTLACVGIANLLLAHGVKRRAEMLVQVALGAGRLRLVRQVLAETLVLLAVGAASGVWLSATVGRWLVAQFAGLPTGEAFMPETVALGAALVLIVTLACGLAPALHATRRAHSHSLAAPLNEVPPRRQFLSPLELLAALQLAVALALLTGGGLLVRSLQAQVDTPLGFRTDDIVTFKTVLAPSAARVEADAEFRRTQKFPDSATQTAMARAVSRAIEPQIRAEYVRNALFVRDLTQRLRALPDVVSIGLVSPTPFTADAALGARVFPFSAVPLGRGVPTADESTRALRGFVSPDGFDILGVRWLSGRSFADEDVAGAFSAHLARIAAPDAPAAPQPVLVNDELARRLWPGSDAVGKQFHGGNPGRPFQVVGVVANFRWTQDMPSDRPAVYLPFAGEGASASFVAKLRRNASSESFAAEVERQVSSLAGTEVARVEVQDLAALVRAGQRDLRLSLELIAWFAALGTFVAGFGVYTSATLSTAARKRELGIRIALGADPARIRRLLFYRLARSLLGLPVGWLLTWVLARQMSHLLVGVGTVDPAAYAGGSVLMLAVLVAASLAPISRAGALDPAAVLRRGD